MVPGDPPVSPKKENASDGRLGTCVAIVQCAVSVEASSSTGASSDADATVVIGSGLRVIARASTSSMRETGTISSPLLMLSAISTRSLAFSSGMSTVLMPPRKAASSFSLRPAIGHTRPRSVISPVIARSRRTGTPVITETIAVTMATPAEGPSFGVAPSGTWTWMSRWPNKGWLDAEGYRARAHVRRRRRDRLLHYVAQVAGHRHAAFAGHHGGFDREQLAADVGPGEPGDDADQGLVLDLAVAVLRHAEIIREVIG